MDDALRPLLTHGTPSRDAFSIASLFPVFPVSSSAVMPRMDSMLITRDEGDFIASGMDGFHLGSVFFPQRFPAQRRWI